MKIGPKLVSKIQIHLELVLLVALATLAFISLSNAQNPELSGNSDSPHNTDSPNNPDRPNNPGPLRSGAQWDAHKHNVSIASSGDASQRDAISRDAISRDVISRDVDEKQKRKQKQRRIRRQIHTQSKREQPDNFGRHFVVVFMSNGRNDGGYLKLFLASKEDTHVEIDIPHLKRRESIIIPANELVQYSIPTSLRLTRRESNRAVRKVVDVLADKEIAVYGINRRSVSTDAFLALPEDIADKEYIVAAYGGMMTRRSRNPAEVAVVAFKDGTEVVLSYHGVEEARVTLQSGQVYQYHRQGTVGDDLTGMKVVSSEPISVFSGTMCAMVPARNGLCDHIVEQVPPVSTWGRKYITAPLVRRLKGDIVRIISGRDNNRIKMASGEDYVLSLAGDFVELDVASDESKVITCTEACLAVQYCKGKNIDGVLADPFMMLIPPIEQFSNYYIFSTPDDEDDKEFDNFITFVIDNKKIPGLTLDGESLANASWVAVPGAAHSFLRRNVTSGVHVAAHDETTVTFGLYVYGYAFYDSYGYPGGLRLAPLYEACVPSLDTGTPGDGIDNDCDGKIDEEHFNKQDDDGDGVIDENDRAICIPSLDTATPGDGIDNDCDGRIDEEDLNKADDDGDSVVDEADAALCRPSLAEGRPGDGLDNDCDGRVDEETFNSKDDDGDGVVDENDRAVCIPSLDTATPGDGIDNDCDGRIDEEHFNKWDDDADGAIDEEDRALCSPTLFIGYDGDQIDNDCDGLIDEEVRNGKDDDGDGDIDEDTEAVGKCDTYLLSIELCEQTQVIPEDGIDNDCDGKIDEEKQNGRDDDGDGMVDEDTNKSGCGDQTAFLQEDVDRLKGDMEKMLDLVRALSDLATPMGQQATDLGNLADQIGDACSCGKGRG